MPERMKQNRLAMRVSHQPTNASHALGDRGSTSPGEGAGRDQERRANQRRFPCPLGSPATECEIDAAVGQGEDLDADVARIHIDPGD